jgi:glyceraldehyde-3-phosphate dehydrogenase/erythrose-4-phosphate dehydrogenase
LKNNIESNNNENSIFKTDNFKYLNQEQDPVEILIDCTAVLLGDYVVYRKHAAKLVLQTLLKDEFLKQFLEDIEEYNIEKGAYKA